MNVTALIVEQLDEGDLQPKDFKVSV